VPVETTTGAKKMVFSLEAEEDASIFKPAV
jgi:hypothetical protein